MYHAMYWLQKTDLQIWRSKTFQAPRAAQPTEPTRKKQAATCVTLDMKFIRVVLSSTATSKYASRGLSLSVPRPRLSIAVCLSLSLWQQGRNAWIEQAKYSDAKSERRN
eukprot:TRINITY_DN20504_c0_g1_i2.p2 TRINITY_DN20504_c0_g1~~TRINITY_DN20504_c0_g1_i2.p2  ORF type:complete len:109 (+),score=7.93 TRINITY_DN20504_c0_g1_i2:78-404(+)